MRAAAGANDGTWAEYLEWNDAVAQVLYPMTDASLPVYMDMEVAELQKIAEYARDESGDPRKALTRAVRAASVHKGKIDLGALVQRTAAWSRTKDRNMPPPCLAFLAVTALAAEDMGITDDDIAGNAYYARLARLLGLPDADTRLRQQYANHAEFLWRCLNRWLDDLDGARGIPTAYALTFRYVGLPMSQALVREGDRQKFPVMFAQFGLSPGMHLAPEDLITYLDVWLGSEQSSASNNLRHLWERPATRERIATVAAVELANWDGTIGDESAVTVGGTPLATRATLVANVRSGFIEQSLGLSLGLRPLTGDMDGKMEVLSTDGSWIDIGFAPGTAGLWRTSYNQAIDFGSILEGVVRLRHAAEPVIEYKRFPRTVIPLVYDELQSAFVESERLQIGADSLVLVRTVSNETKVKTKAADEVERVLAACARPGYRRIDILNGLPPGWALFKDVQLFGSPETHLNELVPLARNKLTLAGGLRIPSKIRKWSTHSPPEVRAAVQSELELLVTLSEATSELVLHEWKSHTGSLVASLSDANLPDGDYRVSLYTGKKSTPIQQSSIRLRSSADVDTSWENAPRLAYVLTDPVGILTATEVRSESEMFIDGLATNGDLNVQPIRKASSKVVWNSSRQVVSRPTIQVGTPDPKSCIVTGAHHFVLPTYYGKTAAKFIEGECKSCAMVKRFPTWPRNRWQKKSDSTADSLLSIDELESVEEQAGPNWDAALDALMHLGGGSISTLESIALQLEGSLLFVDTFIRTLEGLGHIAVERNELFQATRWEISPSCIGETTQGTFRLTGFWPPQDADEVKTRLSEFGTELAVVSERAGPSVQCFTHRMSDVASTLEKVLPRFAIVTHTGLAILSSLPTLSAVARALTRVPMPGFQSAERFDLQTANWVRSTDPYAPGAYRLRRGFESVYVYRSPDDVSAGFACIAPVHLVKHLAANDADVTLAGFSNKSRAVFVPRGCDLPGLYARALIAMSGRVPITTLAPSKDGKKRKCLVYRCVEQQAADILVTLLST
ncbi:hypothetical protein [Mycobacterium aquaticum]|nr:hypothetical protein [Mycobacterium aquaticum]